MPAPPPLPVVCPARRVDGVVPPPLIPQRAGALRRQWLECGTMGRPQRLATGEGRMASLLPNLYRGAAAVGLLDQMIHYLVANATLITVAAGVAWLLTLSRGLARLTEFELRATAWGDRRCSGRGVYPSARSSLVDRRREHRIRGSRDRLSCRRDRPGRLCRAGERRIGMGAGLPIAGRRLRCPAAGADSAREQMDHDTHLVDAGTMSSPALGVDLASRRGV